MNQQLFTIGYTGIELDDFVVQLRESNVECIIDIREFPASRRKGFSKTALRERLEASGIDYFHYRLLGSPRSLRHEVRRTQDFQKFFLGVDNHLRAADSQAQVAAAIDVARRFRSCLMCCCSDWQLCHRKCVVDAILRHAYFVVEHLAKCSVASTRHKAA